MLTIDQRTAGAVAHDEPRPGDVVLAKGSRCRMLVAEELLAEGAA